jgi:hypothetical protein
MGDKADCIDFQGIFLLSVSYKMLSGTFNTLCELNYIFNVDSILVGQMVIKYFASGKYERKMGI